jgi:tRNA(Arg) A34 adenosine deaminase TadA
MKGLRDRSPVSRCAGVVICRRFAAAIFVAEDMDDGGLVHSVQQVANLLGRHLHGAEHTHLKNDAEQDRSQSGSERFE